MLRKFFGGGFVAELKPEEMFCTERMREHTFLWSSCVDESYPKRKIEQLMNAVILIKSNAIFFVELHFCLWQYSVMKKIRGIVFWQWIWEECLFGLTRICQYTEE